MISERNVERLSLYRRALLQMREDGVEVVSSQRLADAVHGKATQVRRDVMALGYSGIPNAGYVVRDLLASISDFMDGPQMQSAALVGVGNLGSALLAHFSGRWRQLGIKVAFDVDVTKVGRTFWDCPVYPVKRLAEGVQEFGAQLGIIATPPQAAQAAADGLCAGGVRGVLNFAPVRVRVPETVYLEHVDLATSLEKVAYFARVKAEGVEMGEEAEEKEEE
jgi:redox-sensing transcriptional repressor